MNLSEGVAETLAEQYGEAVLHAYEELVPENVIDKGHAGYGKAEEALNDLHPDKLYELEREEDLVYALEELNDRIETYREHALAAVMGNAVQNRMQDFEL